MKRPPPGQKNPYPVGGPHDMTLLDGEMVLDHDPEGNQPPRLRYLIYDCCMINSIPIIDKKWSVSLVWGLHRGMCGDTTLVKGCTGPLV